MVNYPDDIIYSSKYEDDVYEYRIYQHITISQISKRAQAIIQTKPNGLLTEQEWRMLGVQQSRGWQHYLVHKPEPHILLFRRPLGTNPQTVGSFYSAFASPTASTSLTAYSITSSTVSIYYMLTQTKRGPLGKILASIFLSIHKDRDGEYLFSLETDKWDGDTKLVSSCLLYYFSLAVNPRLNDKYSVYSSKYLPEFPWGPIDLEKDPFEEMSKIHDYITSLGGGYIRIPLNKVDIWQLYFLAVVKKYSTMRRGKFSLKKILSSIKKHKKQKIESTDHNTVNIKLEPNRNESIEIKKIVRQGRENRKHTGATNLDQEFSVSLNSSNSTLINGQRATLDTYLQVRKLESSSVITDFKIKRRHCVGGSTVVCKNKKNSKVNYISVPWIPGERTAFEELRAIFNYTNTLEDSSINEICVKNKLNKSLANFSLALILYLRERQFDINHIDLVNFKKSSVGKFVGKVVKFANYFFDLFGLAHRKNRVMTASWKRIQEDQWKLNPSKTLEFLIIGSHLQEIRSDKYSSSEWSEFDFAIGTIVHFFVVILGVPLLYGQYVSKVNRRHFLVDREALNLQKYNVPVPHSVKYEVE
ncbi:Cyclin-dependent kinase regulatory subunit family protein [Cryptosporidium felis]|nr:Cyclin-dependent kinase regulatory subunit family protein [Cryptosporidium felis]